jgi:prepilin-type N-terminal cleavage/methylation domain-containing protein
MRANPAGRPRGGFTLVELVLAVAIVTILASLLAGVVVRALDRSTEAAARVEIGQFEVALAAFKADRNVLYVPSSIVLDEQCEYPNRATPGSADNFAVTYLTRVFGKRINLTPVSQGGPGIDWNGNQTVDKYTPPPTLQGQHCLVFFLGGIAGGNTPATAGGYLQPPYGTLGFSRDLTNPANVGPGAAVNKPYFEFKPNRLQMDPSNGFLYYLDPYSASTAYSQSLASTVQMSPRPYAYFGADQGGNYSDGDCSGLVLDPSGQAAGFVKPYRNAPGQWINPRGCQIITAGRNGKFGLRDGWTPGRGFGGPGQDGSDDVVNFSQLALGSPLR